MDFVDALAGEIVLKIHATRRCAFMQSNDALLCTLMMRFVRG